MISLITNAALWNWFSPVWFVVPALIGAYAWLCRRMANVRPWWFAAAMVILVAAFVSPIGALAQGYLFSAHMVQHLLLLLVVPLLLMLSLPAISWDRFRNKFAAIVPALPLLGWAAGLGAMWFWHVPSLCSAATESAALGVVRSATFLLAGSVFWLPIYAPAASYRLPPPTAVAYLFSACVGCTLLGIYITFTSISVCPAFNHPASSSGLRAALANAGFTPGVDQQLGGLLMWVPPCVLYVCAIISVLCRWYTADVVQPAVTNAQDASSSANATT